jgi:hypothetical protein
MKMVFGPEKCWPFTIGGPLIKFNEGDINMVKHCLPGEGLVHGIQSSPEFLLFVI